MLTQRIYYRIKPFIPRSLQIILRRRVVLWKRDLYKNVWPIDERAANRPEGWSGWPNGKRFALVLTHDVETAKGQERCIRLAGIEESMGFRSSFNFVAEEYNVSAVLRNYLTERGWEIGVHGLYHDNNLFRSKEVFQKQVLKINQYLKEWGSSGFRCPSMYHNLDWIGELNVEYDSSTFDTDPFEPQSDGAGRIFPFWVPSNNPSNPSNPINSSNPELVTRNHELVTSNLQPATVSQRGYVELPYTLPQDHSLFVVMQERDIGIWKTKLDWIAEHGGMALLITHPDYMNFGRAKMGVGEYPPEYYVEFLNYIKDRYEGQYWHVLPRDLARFWAQNYRQRK